MNIDNQTVPLTATHYSLESREFLRVSAGMYAQCFINGKHWVECATLTNEDLIKSEVSSDYLPLFKTGLNRDIANIRLMFLGCSYRIGGIRK